MHWICKRCGKTYTTNSGKPTESGCVKDKNGKPQKHIWIEKK